MRKLKLRPEKRRPKSNGAIKKRLSWMATGSAPSVAARKARATPHRVPAPAAFALQRAASEAGAS